MIGMPAERARSSSAATSSSASCTPSGSITPRVYVFWQSMMLYQMGSHPTPEGYALVEGLLVSHRCAVRPTVDTFWTRFSNRVQVAFEQIGVHIQRHRRAGMTEHPLHHLRVRAGRDRQRLSNHNPKGPQ